MHASGWPRLSSQALRRALTVCYYLLGRLSSRYLQLELSRHVLRYIARFHLCAHTLGVETGCWQIHNRHCDERDLHDSQDEKHVLFYAPA